ncbi:MAG: MoaD/ThiS family protein [Pyrinomonadaceae bacterium]
MNVKVMFFGATADITGHRDIELSDASGLSARQVFVDLLNMYPDLSRQKLLMSVNQQYSIGSEIIKAGDELAIFTAVSGG